MARIAAPLLRPDARIAAGRGRYILCYHRIIPAEVARREWVHDAMWVSPASFEEQIGWMKSVGQIVALDRLMDFDAASDRTLFAVTFDDGWRDNLVTALPIMQRHAVPATVFIATASMEHGTLIWPDDLATKTAAAARASVAGLDRAVAELASQALPAAASLRQRLEVAIEQLKLVPFQERQARISRYCGRLGVAPAATAGHLLTWPEAAQLADAGVTLQSHSHSHVIFSEATAAEVERELVESRSRMRQHLGIDPAFFAYPNARYRGTEGPILARLGYRHAFRIHNLPARADNDPYFVPRFIMSEATWSCPEHFKLRLLGILK